MSKSSDGASCNPSSGRERSSGARPMKSQPGTTRSSGYTNGSGDSGSGRERSSVAKSKKSLPGTTPSSENTNGSGRSVSGGERSSGAKSKKSLPGTTPSSENTNGSGRSVSGGERFSGARPKKSQTDTTHSSGNKNGSGRSVSVGERFSGVRAKKSQTGTTHSSGNTNGSGGSVSVRERFSGVRAKKSQTGTTHSSGNTNGSGRSVSDGERSSGARPKKSQTGTTPSSGNTNGSGRSVSGGERSSGTRPKKSQTGTTPSSGNTNGSGRSVSGGERSSGARPKKSQTGTTPSSGNTNGSGRSVSGGERFSGARPKKLQTDTAPSSGNTNDSGRSVSGGGKPDASSIEKDHRHKQHDGRNYDRSTSLSLPGKVHDTSPDSQAILIMIMNADGEGKADERKEGIKSMVRRIRPKLLLFQEFSWVGITGKSWEDHSLPKHYKYFGNSEAGILYDFRDIVAEEVSSTNLMRILEELQRTPKNPLPIGFDLLPRMCASTIKTIGVPFWEFICVSWHGPHNGWTTERMKTYFQYLLEFLRNIKKILKKPLLIAGDFNVEFKHIEQLIQHPFKKYTYKPSKRREKKLIDYFITTEDLELSKMEFVDLCAYEDSFNHDPIQSCVKVIRADKTART